MKRITAIAVCVVLLLCGCSDKDNAMPSEVDMNATGAKLAFTCIHEAEHLPPLSPQMDTLFKYALFLEKQDGPKDYNNVARYYRIAAAFGHDKANHNLQLLISEGFAQSPDAPKETIDLVQQLIAAGVPGGYYDMGHYLELGYGVKKDENKARVYFRKIRRSWQSGGTVLRGRFALIERSRSGYFATDDGVCNQSGLWQSCSLSRYSLENHEFASGSAQRISEGRRCWQRTIGLCVAIRLRCGALGHGVLPWTDQGQ